MAQARDLVGPKVMMMSGTELPEGRSLSLGKKQRIDEICDRFEECWRAGKRPHIEDYLQAIRGPESVILLRELVSLELQYRHKAGETPEMREYASRFPEQTEALTPLFQIRAKLDRAGDTAEWKHSSTSSSRESVLAEEPRLCGRVIGRYRVETLLDRGAFGAVYLAYDPQLDRRVAVKFLHTQRLGPEHIKRFWREARMAARLRHPSIVPVYDVGEVDNLPFIVYDFVEGRTLRAALASGYHPTPSQAATLIGKLACALEYAHGHGVIHRDIKPENVMLDQMGEPHITDFGLARSIVGAGSLTATGVLLGTPAYMSPEQAEGSNRELDHRSDIWSLGVVCYELLAGRRPYAGRMVELLEQVLTQPPEPPRRHNPAIPAELEAICLRCLEKLPSRRYQACRDLAEDLRRWKENRPVASQKTQLGGMLASRCRAGVDLAVTALRNICRRISVRVRCETRRLQIEHPALMALSANARVVAAVSSEYLTPITSLFEVRTTDPPAPEACHVSLWDTESEKVCSSWLGSGSAACAIAVSADGTRVAYASRDGTITLMDARSGQAIAVIDNSDVVRFGGFALSEKSWVHCPGRQIASVSPANVVYLWDTESGDVFDSLGEVSRFTSLALSRDGWFAAMGNKDGGIRLEELGSSTELSGHQGSVDCLAFAADGRTLASAGADRRILLWDPAKKRMVAEIQGHLARITCLGFSEDSVALASAGEDCSVRLWSVRRKREEAELRTDPASVNCLAFSPDGSRLATAASDQTIRLWDARKHCEAGMWRAHDDEILCLAFAPDGTILASGSRDRMVKLWAVENGRQLTVLHGHEQDVCELAFDGSEGTLISVDRCHTYKFWDVKHRTLMATWKATHFSAWTVLLSHDGTTVAAVSPSKTLKIWDVETRNLLASISDVNPTPGFHGSKPLAFSPDGAILAFQRGEGMTCLLKPRTGEAQEVGPLNGHSLAFSPGGRFLAAAAGRKIHLVEVGSGECSVLAEGLDLAVNALAFSPQGTMLAAGGAMGTVSLWDWATGREMERLAGPKRVLSDLAFSEDGRRLTSLSHDGWITTWHARDQFSAVTPKKRRQ